MRTQTWTKFGLAVAGAAFPLAISASASAAPDLRVNIASVSPQPAAPNSQVTVQTRLINSGSSAADLNQRQNGRATHIIRWFFKERETGPDKFVLAQSMLGTLEPGGRKTLNARIRIPSDAKPGMHAICAVADPQNRIRESNERNNRNCTRIRVRPGSGKKPQLKAPGNLKPQIRPDISGPARDRINPGTLQKTCINPAIVELQVGIINKSGQYAGTIQLKAVLKNIGNADYVSRPNQQSVQFHHGGKLIENVRFGNLAEGQVKILKARLPWNATSEFQDTLSARIVYDPDIRNDGNPRNDDCRMGDNRKTVTPAKVNSLFGR
ncbi:MAG: CARDB domain-containing protein [Alphaproteobacteria bacterium]